MKVLGIDQSLTASGTALIDTSVALTDPNLVERRLVKPGALAGPARLAYIRGEIERMLNASAPDLVVIEDYAHILNKMAALAELGGMLRLLCYDRRQTLLVVNPSHVKMFATGVGNAKKDVIMREAFKRWGVEWNDNNLVDAYVLARVGVAYLLDATCETVKQREVIKKLKVTGLLIKGAV